MKIEITTAAKSVFTKSAIGVPITSVLIAIVLAAIASNAAWIIILEIITAGKPLLSKHKDIQIAFFRIHASCPDFL